MVLTSDASDRVRKERLRFVCKRNGKVYIHRQKVIDSNKEKTGICKKSMLTLN